MEYYGNKLCATVDELVGGGIMTMSNYKQMCARGRIDLARRGGGPDRYALVVVDSLPGSYKEKVEAAYPNADGVRLQGWIMSNYEMDQAAVAFFHDRRKTGLDLSDGKKREYIINASVLNTCIKLYERARDYRKLMGEKYNWEMMATAISTLRDQLGHTLPASTLRFRKKVNEYRQAGYGCLISGKFGNQVARKVSSKVERLVIALAVQENKPYNTSTWEQYNMFVTGEYDVYDPETGELFNPDDFTDRKGEPLALSESTVNNILNNPKNKLIVNKQLLSWSAFMHEQMPHMHRHGGDWSLSQVTMDDVDLTRKLKDTKLRVHAYYAYDVVSQCVIGASYGRKKDQSLVVDCFRDMFRLIERNGWGIPAGIEVENHLMSEYREGFLKAGEVFGFVRFCAPLNSQEKYAEPLNGAKKRSVIHKNHAGIGRFYGKGKWRMESVKVSDEGNDTWEDREYFSFEQLVAEDRADSKEWNGQPHPNQKKFPGMTRWDVLVSRINPTLLPYDKAMLSRYIGEAVETSVRRNSTVRVCGRDWWVRPEVLEKLRPNDYKVTAYYLPDEEGAATDVYVYQGDKYIDKVAPVVTYNRVMSEQTAEDAVAMTEQQKRVSHFRAFVEAHAVKPVGVMKKDTPVEGPESEPETVRTQSMAEEYDERLWAPEAQKGNALADL